MSAIQTVDGAKLVEKVVIGGDLSALTTTERMNYYAKVCESLGLNPLTRPFDYLVLSGKTVLYAKRDATDQLRNLHKISVIIASREIANAFAGDVYVVTARATTPEGRTDESIGAVSLGSLKGDALANALMKAETKAKRRVTLSICGLGLLDETEVETIQGAVVESRLDDSTRVMGDGTPQGGVAASASPPRTSEREPSPSPETLAKAYAERRESVEGPSRDTLLLKISTLAVLKYGAKGWRSSVLALAHGLVGREFKSSEELSNEELETVVNELEQAPVSR